MILNMTGQGGRPLLITETYDANGGIIYSIDTHKAPLKLQAKTINPTTSSQTVNPDTGYDGFSQVIVGAGGGTINNQAKTVNPSTSQQIITPDNGYTGLSSVTINAITAMTLPTSTAASATSGFTSKATIGRSTSDQYINIPVGYNSAGAYYKISAVANGTEGTPTATKGTVSNHSVSITPSVTNTAGYISGGTKTGTAITVSASELVSGNKEITSNGTNIDVTNYATVSVSVEGEGSGGYIYQDANGYIVLSPDGEGGGGSGSSGTQVSTTGTFTGNNTNSIQISCAFEPREIYIRGDLTGDVTLRGIVSFTLIKDKTLISSNDSSTSNTNENAWFLKEITGYNEANSASEPYVSYSNGTLTIDTVMNSSGARWTSGITYNYTLVGFASPTEHIIHLEFSDSSETDISLNYDNSLIDTMITNYAPSTWTYNNKTVMLAELDGTAWYDKTTIPIGVELVDFTKLTNDTSVANNGEIVSEQYYCTTDYMPIRSDMTFTFSCLIWSRIGFFDSNYESVGIASPYGSSWATQRQNDTNYCDGTLTGSTIPSNAAFVVLVSTNNADSTHLSLIRTA